VEYGYPSPNTFSFTPGVYLIGYTIIGTGISMVAGLTTTGTFLCEEDTTSTTEFNGYSQIQFTTDGTINFGFTATTVTLSQLFVVLLPDNAVTLTSKKINKLDKLLTMMGDVKAMKAVLENDSKVDRKSVDLKESKCPSLPVTRIAAVSASSSSVTSVASGSVSSFRQPNVNERYILVTGSQ